MKAKFILSRAIVFFIALLFYFDVRPYWLWNIDDLYFKLAIIIFLSLSIFAISQVNIKKLILCLFFTIYTIMYSVSFYGIEISSFGFILAVPFLFFIDDHLKQDALRLIANVYIVLTVISLMVYFYVLFYGDVSFDLISPLNTVKKYYYQQYPFLVTPDEPLDTSIFRFGGVFDEPGVIGTFSALFLTINCIYENRFKRFALVISGICSMSLAFYILAYIFFFMKNKKATLTISFFAIMLTFFVSFNHVSSETINRFVLHRISDLFDGKKVDNRTTEDFDIAYDSFLSGDDIILGKGQSSSTKISDEGFSYKYVIYDHGILSFIMINLIVIYSVCLSNNTRNEKVLFLILLMLSLLQRPYYNNFCFFIILLGWSADTLVEKRISVRGKKINRIFS